MITHVLLLAMITLASCRTARATVEIQDDDAPTRASNPDYLNIDSSAETTFTISALSLPMEEAAYDYLDVSLKTPGESSEVFGRKSYRPGENLIIKPDRVYEVEVTAVKGTKVLYSTKFCSKPSSFRAEQGPNLYTASLCAKPANP